jgi:HAD superfamily hydrolase (TIGR01509 family)
MEHRPIRLVIFDCDGVLVDSERLAVRVDVQALASVGWHVTEAEVVERFVGKSDAHMRREIEAHIGRALPDDWDRAFRDVYLETFRRELRPVDGVALALDAIETATCVASSGTHDKMKFTLGLTGLYARFDGRIFSATEVANGKPAPDLFLHAAARMGTDPRECAVVEDSRFGVAAARAAGMRAFGYAGGLTPAAWLEGADTVVFTDMRELPALLRR